MRIVAQQFRYLILSLLLGEFIVITLAIALANLLDPLYLAIALFSLIDFARVGLRHRPHRPALPTSQSRGRRGRRSDRRGCDRRSLLQPPYARED
jgi:hypothetical protein